MVSCEGVTMNTQVTLIPKYGLNDLIAGQLPTFLGWTVNPTDAAKITDGDETTFCTTGNKVAAGGYQHGIFEWDLGGMYNILPQCVGTAEATGGTPVIYIYCWDGSAWIISTNNLTAGSTPRLCNTYPCRGSKIRLTVASTAAATITPNIREFCVWRLQ